MNHPSAPILQARGIACERGDRTLFEAMDLTVSPGMAVHLEGPNGCGKTSLLRIICGLAPASSGEISWGAPGDDEPLTGRDFVYVGHTDGVKLDLTALENLQFEARVRGMDPSASTGALERLGLGSRAHVTCRALSAGQRRRAALARLALLPGRLWILDEPFTALDAAGHALVRRLVEEHVTRDGAVVLTSHQPLELAVDVYRVPLAS